MNTSKRIAVVPAVVPLVLEISFIAKQLIRNRTSATERDRQRQALDAELDRIGDCGGTMALTELEPLIDAARQTILEATA